MLPHNFRSLSVFRLKVLLLEHRGTSIQRDGGSIKPPMRSRGRSGRPSLLLPPFRGRHLRRGDGDVSASRTKSFISCRGSTRRICLAIPWGGGGGRGGGGGFSFSPLLSSPVISSAPCPPGGRRQRSRGVAEVGKLSLKQVTMASSGM